MSLAANSNEMRERSILRDPHMAAQTPGRRLEKAVSCSNRVQARQTGMRGRKRGQRQDDGVELVVSGADSIAAFMNGVLGKIRLAAKARTKEATVSLSRLPDSTEQAREMPNEATCGAPSSSAFVNSDARAQHDNWQCPEFVHAATRSRCVLLTGGRTEGAGCNH